MSRIGDTLREPFPGYPPPLTTQPEGLLDLLGLQTNGRYPQHLNSETLQPTIDLLRWYLEDKANFKTGQINYTGTPPTFVGDANLTVPAGEAWIPLQFNVWSTAALATTVTHQLGRTNSSGGSFVALSDPTTWTTGQVAAYMMDPAHYGIYLRPSVQLGIMGLQGSTTQFNYTLRYVRLRTG